MPRQPRSAPGGFVYHALNRAVARLTLFQKDDDYAAFERVLAEALKHTPTRVLGYCVMPNHWHLVLWPREDGELTAFLRWLTLTHTQRWHAHHHTAGTGHLYQGRFKAFPIQEDDHFYAVMRYVERNPLRAGLTARAEEWPWSSLGRRQRGEARGEVRLESWPLPRPRDWAARVNRAETEAEVEAIRRSIARGCPFGEENWQQETAANLGLEYTLRKRGRPPKRAAAPTEQAE
jgi:putative transposase